MLVDNMPSWLSLALLPEQSAELVHDLNQPYLVADTEHLNIRLQVKTSLPTSSPLSSVARSYVPKND